MLQSHSTVVDKYRHTYFTQMLRDWWPHWAVSY